VEQPEDDAFDVAGFLKLLDDVMRDGAAGVVSARIHVRDGLPWAISVEFAHVDARAA
jgi:hypothetical protein